MVIYGGSLDSWKVRLGSNGLNRSMDNKLLFLVLLGN